MGRNILVLEDDPLLAESLKIALTQSGYTLTHCQSLGELAHVTRGGVAFDLFLLDLALPDGKSINFCQSLRAAGNTTPVLFMTASVAEETAVQCLQMGADDYIRKPFGLRELLARIDRVFERAILKGKRLDVGNLTVYLSEYRATFQGKDLGLGRKEFEIFIILAKKFGEVVSRDTLLEAGGDSGEVFDRTIDSHVSHIRKKLESAGVTEFRIMSVYGTGYRLDRK